MEELLPVLPDRGVTVDRVEGDAAAFVKAALAFASDLDVAGVAPGFDYLVPAAAEVAADLGLPGPAPEAAEVLTDKHRTERALAAAGVPAAGGFPFSLDELTPAGLQTMVSQVGFPAVLKPVNGSGSLRVRRVDDMAALRSLLAEDLALGPVEDLGRLIGTRLLLEPYLHGPEFSVEGVVDIEGPRVVAVTEKQLGPEPHFVEVGHIVEAGLPPDERAALESVALAAVTALGLTAGAFHLEARLTARGPVVIEVGARLGGDRIHRLVAGVYGFDLPRAMVSCLTHRPVAARGAARGVAGVRFLTVPEPARITDPHRLRERLGALPGCVEVSVDFPPASVLRPATDFRQRFGHLVLHAPDRPALNACLADADRVLAQTLEPLTCTY